MKIWTKRGLTTLFLGGKRTERNRGVDMICPLAAGCRLVDESVAWSVSRSFEDKHYVVKILANIQYIP